MSNEELIKALEQLISMYGGGRTLDNTLLNLRHKVKYDREHNKN